MHKTTLVAAALLTACATAKPDAPQQTQAPGTSAAEPEQAEAEIEVDDSAPMKLDAWRSVQAEGKAAVRIENLDERIAKCRAFVEEHGDHQEVGPVLEALTDALVEKGGYDKADLGKLVEHRAAADDDNAALPIELVRKYHAKHDLPVDSATRLLELSRTRIKREFREAALEKDESRRERRELALRYRRADSYIAEGRLHLAHGDAKEALASLEKAELHAEKFPRGIAVFDAEGKQTDTLAAGSMDSLPILKAAALRGLGKKDAAKQTMRGALGFGGDPEVQKLYDDNREQLGLVSKREFTVKSEALPAQNFKLKDIAGKKVALTDYRGKVVLIAFWATWCAPCKRELPELQKFARAHKDKGVEVITISTDRFADRVKIAPFLKKANLDLPVLLEDPEQLTSYNYQAIPALYVIDREGKVAHARTGYNPNLKDKLENQVLPIVDGTRKSGRDMLSIEKAPQGFGLRWQKPVSGNARALAIGPAVGTSKAEVAVVGPKGLMRFSAGGQPLGDKPVSGWAQSLRAADLDGDGKREWIVGGFRGVKVLDAAGELYWEHEGRRPQIAGVHDFNGDGFSELIFRDHERVYVMKATPDPLWKTPIIQELEGVQLMPGGTVAVQADGELTEYDGRGKVVAKGTKTPTGRFHAGRVSTKGGEVDLYRGRWDSEPILGHDVDGDGEEDIVVPGHQGVVVYNKAGDTILRIRSHDVGLETTVGDLDDTPGAELAIHVEHYGLVVLGKK